MWFRKAPTIISAVWTPSSANRAMVIGFAAFPTLDAVSTSIEIMCAMKPAASISRNVTVYSAMRTPPPGRPSISCRARCVEMYTSISRKNAWKYRRISRRR